MNKWFNEGVILTECVSGDIAIFFRINMSHLLVYIQACKLHSRSLHLYLSLPSLDKCILNISPAPQPGHGDNSSLSDELHASGASAFKATTGSQTHRGRCGSPTVGHNFQIIFLQLLHFCSSCILELLFFHYNAKLSQGWHKSGQVEINTWSITITGKKLLFGTLNIVSKHLFVWLLK